MHPYFKGVAHGGLKVTLDGPMPAPRIEIPNGGDRFRRMVDDVRCVSRCCVLVNPVARQIQLPTKISLSLLS